jgi:hypothetical protein
VAKTIGDYTVGTTRLQLFPYNNHTLICFAKGVGSRQGDFSAMAIITVDQLEEEGPSETCLQLYHPGLSLETHATT